MTAATNGHAIEVLGAELRAFVKLMDERDRRYTEGKENDQRAVSAALAANEKLTNSAFAASREAIGKAEANQTSYNATHNDLTRKMDQQYKEMVPRSEAEARFKALEEKIGDLRESRSQVSGKELARIDTHADVKWIITTVVSIGIAIGAILFSLLKGH